MAKSQIDIEDLSGTKVRDEDPAPKKASSSKRSAPRASVKQENELRDRLTMCFDRIAEALENRDDIELAEIVRDDAEVMAGGLVSMTRPLKALRAPLLVFVAIVEPALAFGRIARVLVGRFAARRAVAMQQAQWDAENAEQDAAIRDMPVGATFSTDAA